MAPRQCDSFCGAQSCPCIETFMSGTRRSARIGMALLMCAFSTAGAQEFAGAHAPGPLTLADVTREAVAHRSEIAAARARAEALAQRPAIVGALEDPMVSPAIDHYPFDMMEEGGRRYDWSVSIEQSFPLSGVRGHRRKAARADADRAAALSDQTVLDVVYDAQRSFFMLRERQLMRIAVEQQLSLARELASAATARYASGTGTQADVLRAEVEVARISATQRALESETRAAKAMLNASLGRPIDLPVGELEDAGLPDRPLPPMDELLTNALHNRPELRAGQAEVARATAEVAVMRSMYSPMATIRVGRASTMAEGDGAMLMVGVTVPIWRDKLRAGVAEARTMERMAGEDVIAMRRMVEGQTAAAYSDVQAARETRRSLASDVEPRARLAVEAALSDYATGRTTLTSVIEASRALWDVRTDRIMAETAANLAEVRLERQAGNRADTEAP